MQNLLIEILPARDGDCLIVDTCESLILIDAGYSSTFETELRPRLQTYQKQARSISRFIITHVDADHIEGAIRFLAENGNAKQARIIEIGQVWHNSFRHISDGSEPTNGLNYSGIVPNNSRSSLTLKGPISAKQGSTLAGLINRVQIPWNTDFNGRAVTSAPLKSIQVDSKSTITVISPQVTDLNTLKDFWLREFSKVLEWKRPLPGSSTEDLFEYILTIEQGKQNIGSTRYPVSKAEFDVRKLAEQKFLEDSSITNRSSIAFILNFEDKKCLFLGDSHPSVILDALTPTRESGKPMAFDLIKVSHHGSYSNNSPKLFEAIDSRNYCISTDGNRHGHPNLETLAWIIKRPAPFKRHIYFNYRNEAFNILNDPALKREYNYEVICPVEGTTGVLITL